MTDHNGPDFLMQIMMCAVFISKPHNFSRDRTLATTFVDYDVICQMLLFILDYIVRSLPK